MCRKKWIVIMFGVILVAGCAYGGTAEPFPVTPVLEIVEADAWEQAERPGEIRQFMNTEKKMALTFNGLADEQTMMQLLDELDRFDIKATFFLPGMRVAEDPELARRMLKRGHTIQNNTLNHVLPDDLDYEEAYVEIALANKVFHDHLKIEPRYVRSRSADSSAALEAAAAQQNMEVVTFSINPKDSQMQSAEEIAAYIQRYSNRGAIITLNTYMNPAVIPAIELIYHDATAAGYTLTTLEDVSEGHYLTNVAPRTNDLVINEDYAQAEPQVIRQFETDEKEIALTFDDWASDETISAVLDILDSYGVQSTFFLIGSGVENRPQLAKLIKERGHEVGNHSYSHQVITTMDPQELQEDIVMSDHVLSYALQEKPLNYFRPAQGVVDDKTVKVVAATGVEYIVLFDVASHDWDLSITEDDVFQRVHDRTGPGSIIGMHILDDSHVINVLPRIIDYYQQKGYTFKTISEMIQMHIEGGASNQR